MVAVDYGFEAEKFKVIVRYLIRVAQDKRCVTYGELENVFGLSHRGVGWYEGRLGDYCTERNLPLLKRVDCERGELTPKSWIRLVRKARQEGAKLG